MLTLISSDRKSHKVVRRLGFGLICLALVPLLVVTSPAATKKRAKARVVAKRTSSAHVSSFISRDPYIGAIVVDSATGRAIFEDNADGIGYPASVVKLIDLLIIMEKVQQGTLRLTDRVTVAPEACNVGGSQCFLRPREIFTIDELLYALMIKSANDAATALAIHVGGSKDAFIEMMNHKASELGMTSTHFNSVNGLPPQGKPPDQSTPRDLSLLARAVLKHPEALRYTSTRFYAFRKGEYDMNNHNHLLGALEGCDGLKTGYFSKAGFSIVATAQRDNVRLVTVVLGSRFRNTRDRQAKSLLTESFRALRPSYAQASAQAGTRHN